MEALNIVLVSDGRPGHEKQSKAILSALQAKTQLSVTTKALSALNGFQRAVQGMGLLVRGGPNKSTAIDLIIGTGSRTHLPMVGLKLRTRAKSVTCMTPEPWFRPWFDLCFVPRHDRGVKGRNFFYTFGPPCLPMRSDRHDCRKGLILAGGLDPKSHQWNPSDLIAQIEMLITKMGEISWTLATSPRTPVETILRLENLSTCHSHVVLCKADETPPGWIESAYESHDQVWVTADSVSMIYEALTAGCRVGILPVHWRKNNNKFQIGINDLIKRQMIVDFHQWVQGEELPKNGIPLNEAERCAEEILKRWWPNRLV